MEHHLQVQKTGERPRDRTSLISLGNQATRNKAAKTLTSFLTISEGNVCLEITQSARVRVFLSDVFAATLFTAESRSCTSVAGEGRHST